MFNKYFYENDPNTELIIDEHHFPWISAYIMKNNSETFTQYMNEGRFDKKLNQFNLNKEDLVDKNGKFCVLMLRIHFDTFDKLINYRFKEWFFNTTDKGKDLDFDLYIKDYLKNYNDTIVHSIIELLDNEIIGLLSPFLYCQYKLDEKKQLFAVPFDSINERYRNTILSKDPSKNKENWNLDVVLFLLLKKHYDDFTPLYEIIQGVSNALYNRMMRYNLLNLSIDRGTVIISNFLSKLKFTLSKKMKENNIFAYNFNIYPDTQNANFSVLFQIMKNPKDYDALIVQLYEHKFSFSNLSWDYNFYTGEQYLLINQTIIRLMIIPDVPFYKISDEDLYQIQAFDKATYVVTLSTINDNKSENLFSIIPYRDLDALVEQLSESIIKSKDKIFSF